MVPVAAALDSLQGEKYMFMGDLLPTGKDLLGMLEEREETATTGGKPFFGAT